MLQQSMLLSIPSHRTLNDTNMPALHAICRYEVVSLFQKSCYLILWLCLLYIPAFDSCSLGDSTSETST